MNLNWMAIMLLSLVVCSCSNPDEQLPEIRLVEANDIAGDHLHGLAGTTNLIAVEVADNDGLLQVKCELVTPSGIHQHELEEGQSESAFEYPNLGAWDTMHIYNIDGTSASKLFSFEAPDTISGGWQLMVSVLDKEGNLFSKDFTLHMQNDSLPFIVPTATIPAADAEGILHLSPLDSLKIIGNIADFSGLAYVKASIRGNNEEVYFHEWNAINNWTFDLSELNMPPLPSERTYLLTVEAADINGWKNYVSATIVVE